MKLILPLCAVFFFGVWVFLLQEQNFIQAYDEVSRLLSERDGIMRILKESGREAERAAEEQADLLRKSFALSRRLYAIKMEWESLKPRLSGLEKLMVQAEDLIKEAEKLTVFPVQ